MCIVGGSITVGKTITSENTLDRRADRTNEHFHVIHRLFRTVTIDASKQEVLLSSTKDERLWSKKQIRSRQKGRSNNCEKNDSFTLVSFRNRARCHVEQT